MKLLSSESDHVLRVTSEKDYLGITQTPVKGEGTKLTLPRRHISSGLIQRISN